ncbi:hypothetical protein PPSIR1_41674 [Plesiocystis pacifica SIR-1]|uniref:Peptidase S74 domain-containing protein n=1 Tax=Plesiocystis pacifica SIR-1 TaxID=391625 RepID=A6G0S6_9BACT|nr:tail fiber domain-containing protein [Plesiocystis pacifica]EDM80464.1 hypothetical protein PPSIR1_41674 [Plesiocystis pacifica SIR-1]
MLSPRRAPTVALTLALFTALACADDSGDATSDTSDEATDADSSDESPTTESSSEGSESSSTESESTDSTSTDSTDSTSTDSTDSTDAGMCGGEGASCANAELCCEGLMCCAGLPVPRGEEFCGVTCPMSDRELKRDFQTVDTQAVLDALVALPVAAWTYKDDPHAARHIGPMAQDFRAAFEVGASERAIFQVDADGVSFAAIQALDAKLEDLEAENEALRETVAALEARLAKLEAVDE